MAAVVWLLAALGAAAAWCMVVLSRRDRGRSTENVDGLLIEQQAAARAKGMRADVGAFVAGNGRGSGWSDERRC
jgi:hypothetical protein